MCAADKPNTLAIALNLLDRAFDRFTDNDMQPPNHDLRIWLDEVTALREANVPKFRIRFVNDPDGRFEESNGEPRPLTRKEYKGAEYYKGGKPIPYAEYLRYYGNPDRHVYLQSEIELQCPACGSWDYVHGTGNIDCMDDNQELQYMDRWFSPEELLALEGFAGYLFEIGVEDLMQAGWEAPDSLKCGHEGCNFNHVQGGKLCATHGKGK